MRFESVQPVLLENMGWLLLASGFCMFGLMFVFVITIVVIMRQQKLSVIKNDFINNMTHEFKTPLATISLATSALTKEKVLDDREQILKFNAMIRSENNRMNKYVERILQQAKLDRRELQLNKVKVEVNELVREAVEHFFLLVQEAGGTLECKLEASDFVLSVDEVHLMNAVCNLIDNAIKYSGNTDIYSGENGCLCDWGPGSWDRHIERQPKESIQKILPGTKRQCSQCERIRIGTELCAVYCGIT